MSTPHVVGIGGTTRANSSTEKAVAAALAAAAEAGATTVHFTGPELAELPHYDPTDPDRHPTAERLIKELRAADGIIIGSPGYHGSISGMIKNALDYTEDMREDDRVYFEGRAVGIVATGYGWQGVVATMTTLRQIVHALRGYPTPLGAGINSLGDAVFDADGNVVDDKANQQLTIVGREVTDLARRLMADQP